MDIAMIDSIIFPFARILPFIAVFLIMRGVEKLMPSRMRGAFFYVGLLFAIAGVVYGEIMWYVLKTPFGEPGIYLVVIELLNMGGALSLYIFVNMALQALGKKSYAVSDLSHPAFVFSSFLAMFLAVAMGSENIFRGLSDLLMSPFSYFLYARSILLIYEIYEKLGAKLSFFALIGAFLMVLSMFFSFLPDFGLFLEGSLTDVDTQRTFLMLDLFQATGCALSALPAISLRHNAKICIKELPELTITLYLQKLVDTFGSGVLGLFREIFKEYERDGVIRLKEGEWGIISSALWWSSISDMEKLLWRSQGISMV
jgi:hypothetical protein